MTMTMNYTSQATVLQRVGSWSIVRFQLGPQQYGLPVEAVREVVRLPALIALAGVAPELCGLLNLRGLYLPVFDGRILIGETAEYDLSRQIIIVGRARPELGLLVDQVDGVIELAGAGQAELQRPVASPLLDSLVDVDNRAVMLLSVTALLALAAEAAPMLIDGAH
jgi:purine-binding chemotaxis protein CheW